MENREDILCVTLAEEYMKKKMWDDMYLSYNLNISCNGFVGRIHETNEARQSLTFLSDPNSITSVGRKRVGRLGDTRYRLPSLLQKFSS